MRLPLNDLAWPERVGALILALAAVGGLVLLALELA